MTRWAIAVVWRWRENYAYVADHYNGLRVVDITIPAAPTEAGSCDEAGFPRVAVAVMVWRCRGTTPTWRLGVVVFGW